MFLNNKQMLKLLSPFLVVGLILYFQDDITRMLLKYLPVHKEVVRNILNNQMQQYLKVSRDMKPYEKISKKAVLRQKYLQWTIDKVIYDKISDHPVGVIQNIKVSKQSVKIWRVEAIFPDEKIAIVNSKIVKEGSKIDGAMVKKIKNDMILLKTLEGLKWIKLFH